MKGSSPWITTRVLFSFGNQEHIKGPVPSQQTVEGIALIYRIFGTSIKAQLGPILVSYAQFLQQISKMQFNYLLTLIAAAATGANANVAATRALHLADFRVYSQPGCDGGNLGIVSVYEGDVRPGGCKQLVDHNIKSVSTVDINTNCKCA